ncbi:chaplin [Actinocrinis puniceicyclus]|uniref:Chaplin n=1 Tax=Actinocrinis puniceicyclus TaxID=977794 RepID=A0A8J8BCN0_9ACTN|nr:chaplin [Actinocrinis puniceicyclus]MBS2961944.1 chaplin [Actinocrinis puniceicyclus]
MYDMAKRSLAFTVATGGLLLTGTGYAPAEAAVGFGAATDPAPGASASSTVSDSGGVLSGNTLQIPVDIPVNVCGNQVAGIAVGDTVGGGTCGAAGGSGGASAAAASDHSGGVLSGNTLQIPVYIPVNVCGNQVAAVAMGDQVGGSTCGGGAGGASAVGASSNSGGTASGNLTQLPISLPVYVCGDQVDAVGIGNGVNGSVCDDAPPAITPGGTPAATPSGTPSGTPGGTPSASSSASPGDTPSSSPSGSPCGECGSPSSSPSASPSGSPCGCGSPSSSPSSPASTSPSYPPSNSQSNSPTMMKPPGTPTIPPGQLASTGTEEGLALAAAGAALLTGLGLRTASRRGRRSR